MHAYPRVAGSAWLLGGAAWVVWVVLGERRPPCCPAGVTNAFLPEEWVKLAAYALLAVAALGLAAGAAGRLGGVAQLGALLLAGGGAVGAVGLALEAAGLVLPRPFPEIGALVLLLPAGSLLLGAGSLGRGPLPRHVAAALVLGGLLLVAGNSETRAMLLWGVAGVAWVLGGAWLLGPSPTARTSAGTAPAGRPRRPARRPVPGTPA